MTPSNHLNLILDSTQIATFLECPRLWHYEYDQAIEPLQAEEKDALNMGSYGHKILEVYYKTFAATRDQSKSIQTALAYDIDKDYIGKFHRKCNGKLEEKSSTLEDGTTLTWDECTHCGKQVSEGDEIIRTEGFQLDQPKRKEVRERCETTFWRYSGNDFHVESPDQVEVGFSEKIYESADRTYILEGKMDLFNVDMKGQTIGFVDHKFQLRRRDLYKKSVQFRNYGMVAKASIAMVDYIRLTKKQDNDTWVRTPISFVAGEHEWWKGEVIKVYHRVADALAAGSTNPNYWTEGESNPNWAMCSGMYGYPCKYTPLCEVKNPDLVQMKIQNDFKDKDMWRPW